MYTIEQIRNAGVKGEICAIDVEHLITILIESVGSNISDKPDVRVSLPPVEAYSFVEWIASSDFDWYFDKEVELWRKDGWFSRTTAELLEFWSRRQ